jgi:hypothetical protein
MTKQQHEPKRGRVSLGKVSESTRGTGAKPFETIGLRNEGIQL